MLYPKKVKHRKWQRDRSNPKRVVKESRGVTLAYGQYGVKATTSARLRSNQIEAARRVIVRSLGKGGRVWIRVFPDRPWTKKPDEVGMGKGKGDPQGFEVQVWPGRILFEVEGVAEGAAREAMHKALAKLPLKGRFVARNEA
ncbi:50S ribosomal protein L16 [Candidatus Parcubacteria bacterium]|nr:MAG: 50S ribosomal protein L16 [Candidatus Parcubacteria bacterium]GIW68831.1 MAG: 50S ribosomal protein L16 [Candidatus Parcubacteria bacterium]